MFIKIKYTHTSSGDNMKDIVPFLTSIATILIAFLTFKLQLDMRKDKLRTRKLEYIKHASNVYYFLKDILNDKKKISLTEKEYMYDINYIKYKIINIEEYNLLKNIYTLYKEKDYR